MRDRTKKKVVSSPPAPVINLDEVLDKLDLSEKANKALIQRIDSLIMKVAVLEKTLETAIVTDEKIWDFDVNRDRYGRIQNVKAHQTGA